MEKVSQITVTDIANYIRLAEVSEDDEKELQTYLNVAKSYISNYTGLPIENTEEGEDSLDSFTDFIIVVYILCQDMYDNRTMYVEKNSVNKVVQTILDMHTRNNL